MCNITQISDTSKIRDGRRLRDFFAAETRGSVKCEKGRAGGARTTCVKWSVSPARP